MIKIIPPAIENLSPYVPGRLIEEVEAEMGISGMVKLASNENSLGSSPLALAAVEKALPHIFRYGDADSRALKNALAAKYGFDPAGLVCGNGSSEFILVLAHALISPGANAVMSRPSFTLYAKNVQAAAGRAIETPLTPEYGHDLQSILGKIDKDTRLVFLDNPLNPTGAYLEPDALTAFYEALPETVLLVLDEAYIEFSRRARPDYGKWLKESERVVIMRTFSKIYGLAGLRAAYAVMSPQLASALNKIRQPFNTSLLAQIGAEAALSDDDFLRKTLNMTWSSLDYYAAELPAIGLKVYPTEANFMMAALPEGRSADEVFQALLRQGVIIRSLSSFGLDRHLRFNAGLETERRALVEAFKKVLYS
jgi:histidinol-phosphate aminotransferase